MENQVIKLTSSGTKVGLVFGTILALFIFSLVILLCFADKEITFGTIFAPIFGIGLLGFLVYLLIYSSDAKITKTHLVVKKIFKREQTILFESISKVDSFHLKRTKFTTVIYKVESGEYDKAILINSSSMLSFNNIDSEEILLSILSEVKQQDQL